MALKNLSRPKFFRHFIILKMLIGYQFFRPPCIYGIHSIQIVAVLFQNIYIDFLYYTIYNIKKSDIYLLFIHCHIPQRMTQTRKEEEDFDNLSTDAAPDGTAHAVHCKQGRQLRLSDQPVFKAGLEHQRFRIVPDLETALRTWLYRGL